MALSLDELIIKRILSLFFILLLLLHSEFFLVFAFVAALFVTMGYRTGLFVAVVVVVLLLLFLLLL